MSKYTCEKCGKEFKQKGHYTTHLNKKNPCVNELKIKEIVDKAVEEKISKIKNTIVFDIVEDETIIEPTELENCEEWFVEENTCPHDSDPVENPGTVLDPNKDNCCIEQTGTGP